MQENKWIMAWCKLAQSLNTHTMHLPFCAKDEEILDDGSKGGCGNMPLNGNLWGQTSQLSKTYLTLKSFHNAKDFQFLLLIFLSRSLQNKQTIANLLTVLAVSHSQLFSVFPNVLCFPKRFSVPEVFGPVKISALWTFQTLRWRIWGANFCSPHQRSSLSILRSYSSWTSAAHPCPQPEPKQGTWPTWEYSFKAVDSSSGNLRTWSALIKAW